MTFSIIIAAYNVAPYISKAIESCINQQDIDKKEYEIIIIDDGSTDDTGKIIDNYRNTPNTQIVHKQNGGLSNTRNYGVGLSKGDFIFFLDGDDWLLPNALCTVKSKTNQVDLIVFPMVYWYPDKKEQVESYNLKENFIYTSNLFLKETLGKQKLNIIPAPCKCYRKSILLENRQSFIENILHEDNPYFADTMKNFDKIAYIDKGIYAYRQQRKDSITNSHTLRNFNGVVTGNKYILSIWGYSNKYINYMVSSTNIFQVIIKYDDPKDQAIAISYFRGVQEKRTAIKQIFNFPFIPKAILRHILLIIDPKLLVKVIDIMR